ncbi:MAG: phosphoglycolate phosphatase [Pseudomonadota bacterium]
MNVVFDLDGTLIDSAPDIQAMASKILDQLGKPPLSIEDTRRFIGEGAAVFVERMLRARGIADTGDSYTDVLDRFLAAYSASVDKAEFYPGAFEALQQLNAAGFSLGLCTNKPHAATLAVLSHMKIEQLFDALIAGGMLSSRKPHPAMLQKVIADMGGGHTLFVGDSEIDAETARRASVPFALFIGGYRKTPVSQIQHDWQFAHFSELLGIVNAAKDSSVQ